MASWPSSELRVFLWRTGNFSPFEILVTEMLLRKTRAESVEQVLPHLLSSFPDPSSFATAELETVEGILRPLGLHHIRAKALVQVSQVLVSKYGGSVPDKFEALMDLPHVGRYVANATLTFAFGQERPLVDGNFVRVFMRLFGTKRPVEVHKADDLWDLAADLVKGNEPKHFWWAALDHGSLICTRGTPRCSVCPLNQVCPSSTVLSPSQTRGHV